MNQQASIKPFSMVPPEVYLRVSDVPRDAGEEAAPSFSPSAVASDEPAVDQQFPYFTERLLNYLAVHRNHCNVMNVRNTTSFRNSLESWKQSARWLRGQGKPYPAAPEVPMLMALDEAKCEMRFRQWETGLPQQFDFYIYTRMPISDAELALDPPPLPQPDDPVAGPDGSIAGQFLVARGDTNPIGRVIDHPKYGRLMKIGHQTPFGTWVRWVKI